MLQLYNLNKIKIKGLRLYKDMNIESVLSSGDKTLSFLYPSRLSKDIKEECYIRTKKDEFVVKEISTNGEWNSIKARLNVDELEGQAWEHFDTTEKTIAECLTLAVAGTGWTVQVNGVTKRRTIRKTNCSTWDIIQQAKKTYLVEIEFDTINKVVKVAEKLGSDKGVYFMDSLNLRNLDVQSNSYDFYTRLVAIGKDDLKVTVENFQYSNKKKTLIWKDERYTDINSLTEDATKKLEEISKPYKAYGADIVDLANTSNKYSILNYGLGDTITLISKDKRIKEKQRIVKITEYPEEPHRNKCEIANSILSFADVQKEYNDTMDTVSNITEDNGTVSEGAIRTAVEHLTVNKLDVGSLNAVEIRVGNLEATSATITQLKAVNASIVNLQANKANITDLTASVGRIEILESSVGDIQTLVNGNLTSNNIQSLILSSDKVTVVNGFIKNAMIENLDVSKINAGDISVNKFRIKSDSGNLLIFDNTIQIKDSTRVRVQIGKDASNDYNMYVWDSSGKLMFDATGLKADGIKNKIIRDDMVSDNANISGNKLNISSVVTSINNGATTINSSKVLLDGTAQTLDVAFNTLTTKVDSAPPTIITDSSITKLDGAIDGMLKINSISGRTLQNLILPTTTVYGTEAGGYFYKLNNHPIVDIGGKTLTLINTTPRTVRFNFTDLDGQKPTYVDVFAYGKTKITLNPGKRTSITGIVAHGWTEANKTELNGMILEGDWTNKEIPSYFEGIRSVGESENLELISCGKNLARYLNDKNVIRQGVSYYIQGGHYVITGTATGSGGRTADMDISLIKLYANKTYTLSVNNLVNLNDVVDIAISDTVTGNVINKIGVTAQRVSFTISKDLTATIGINVIAGKTYDCTFDVMIEEGDTTLTTSTPYEPYKEHRQTIPLTNPLRGLPNGVRDTINKGVVTRNVGKVILNGSEEWSINATYSTDTHTCFQVGNVAITPSYLIGISNNFICKGIGNKLLEEGFQFGGSGSPYNVTFIRIINSKLISPTVEGFKAWLQANPTTVYYQLATPVEEPIDVEQYMKQLKDGYLITEGSLINPTVDLTYSTSLASATSMMKEVTESNTTSLNIQQGKISALISNTTIVKDGQNIQLKDAYNSTVATVNSINSVISTHTSKIDALTGQVNSVDTKTNEVKRDLDGVKTSVSSATTTANSALSKATEAKQTVDGFSQRVSNIETDYATTTAVNSAITQQANSIKLEVSNAYVTKTDAVNTYATKSSLTQTEDSIIAKFTSTGGYNLFRNSAFANKNIANWGTYNINIYRNNDDYFMPEKGWIALFVSGATRGLFYQYLEKLTKGKRYTLSIKSWWESGVSNVRVIIDYKNGSTYIGNTVFDLENDGSQRKAYTFTVPNLNFDTCVFHFEVNNLTGASGSTVATIQKPCLCEGDVAVWSPHPSELIDGSTQIDANGVTIYNGAIDVRNRAGSSVLKGDSNGNLMVRGNLYADPANPILRLFGGCSIDATSNNEQGVGDAVRLKWDALNYVRVATNYVSIYQNGTRYYEFNPGYLKLNQAVTYFNEQCKIDCNGGAFRLYSTLASDTGIKILNDGTVSFLVNGVQKHVFNTNGTKAGGTIVVDGVNLGMSPIDSPKVLLEDVLFDIDVQEEGTTVVLDSTFIKTISTYAVFCSNPSVNIVSKDRTSFTVRGYNGKVDFRVIGYRIGYEEQYYQVVG